MTSFTFQDTGASEVLTPEAAQAQIAAIMGNPADLYHANHSGKQGHDERIAEVSKLFAIAYPEEKHPQASEGESSPSAQVKGVEEISLPTMPEGVTWDKNTLGDFRELTNALDIPAATAARVLELEAECWRQEPPTPEESMAQLREHWGAETERRVYAARWFVQTFVPVVLQAALERSGLGDHPEMVGLCAEEGERRLAALKQGKPLVAEIAKYTPGSSEYESAVAKRDELYHKVYGRRRV